MQRRAETFGFVEPGTSPGWPVFASAYRGNRSAEIEGDHHETLHFLEFLEPELKRFRALNALAALTRARYGGPQQRGCHDKHHDAGAIRAGKRHATRPS
jgi:hypothetical protein